MKGIDACEKAFLLMKEIPRDERGNPLTLEGAIRSIILKSPDLASYRDHALGVLYTLLGSRIGWIDGRLGDESPNNYMNMPPDRGRHQGIYSETFGMSESLNQMLGGSDEDWKRKLLEQFKHEHWERQQKDIKTIFDIDNRCQQYSPTPRSWYPISWYGCNLCVPENAQSDFFDGAIETASLILEQPPLYGTEKWRVWIRTSMYAKDILKVLMARKEKEATP